MTTTELLDPEKIIKTVADYYGFTTDQLKGRERQDLLVEARHIALYLLTIKTPMWQKDINTLFGSCDANDFSNRAYHKIKRSMQDRPEIRWAVEDIEKILETAAVVRSG